VNREQPFSEFIGWWRQYCQGDEKGEAQIFLDRFLKAFGYEGAIEAGGTFENRVRRKRDGRTAVSFADYLLPGKVLIEMKKRGEDLNKHYDQLEEYWKNLESKPRYAILCNFDEIWIYDFPTQFYDPVDQIPIPDLSQRLAALEFLVPGSTRAPVFQNNLVDVTKDAAHSLSQVFKLVLREHEREIAQRFILQSMIALFAEDIGLLPGPVFTRIIEECLRKEASAYDLLMTLFHMMNYPGKKRRGRFYDVDYFDGGLFSEVHPVDLSDEGLTYMRQASRENWSRIRPAIFGVIFEDSLDKDQRHQIGAHFTSELDIKRIVDPVIVQPWDARIEAAHDATSLRQLHAELCAYQVLDPACGSGNFLYIAYREMKKLEGRIFDRLRDLGAELPEARVTARQFWGFDINPFAVELAKVTLMIAKKLAVDELGSDEQSLPLDNLDANIRCADALSVEWPAFDACIGNPPYMGAKRLKQEHPAEYINRVRAAFPDVPGNADYCVYWFRKAHELMQPGTRAGLVGTNTIRQNYSREGGLDYIVAHDGHIYDAISSMPWSGEAVVHVSIANWSKGKPPKTPAILRYYEGEGENGETLWREYQLPEINSALSEKIDVSDAAVLECNREPKRITVGQQTGSVKFVLSPQDAMNMIRRDLSSRKVVYPYLIGRDLTSNSSGKPSRYVIDLNDYDIVDARQFKEAYQHVEKYILPAIEKKVQAEAERNRQLLEDSADATLEHEFEGNLRKWWKHARGREEVMIEIRRLDRYIVCSRHTKRPVFDFVSSRINPDSALIAFVFDDDYSFGILQSDAHWQWFTEKASTLKADYRYTPNSVFDTFPWPQNPTNEQVKAVAGAGRALHEFRRERMNRSETLTLRDLYRSLEQPGQNPLKDLHAALDTAVMAAYGFDPDGDVLAQLLALNQQVAARIEAGEPVTSPGIPPDYPDPAGLVSAGCIQPPELI
jgi:SAM-dependent methyltransferase